MKKVLAIFLCALMLLSSANITFAKDCKIYDVSLDLSQKSPFGTFDGWGTSICWWGHHLGENLTSEQLEEVVKALYDEKTGLGLNIARYNIGGGDDPTHNHQREFDGRNMPGLCDKDGNWSLENDKGQLTALELCVKYGADILEAFSNSPPYYMTESGCSSGNHNSGENNLPDDKFEEFAEYLAEAVLRIQNEYKIKFDTLEPFNESDTNYWGYEGWQEGCHFDVEDHSRLILLVREALDKRGLEDVMVSAADETNVWRTGENIKKVYTKEAIDALGRVNTHSYSVGDYNYTKNAVSEAGKKLYMTEVDGDGSIGGEKSGNMGPALWFANKINEDLRGLEPNAWVMWQAAAMAYDGEHKDSGYWNVLSVDQNTGEVNKTKKYYAYKQFTKFIRPGDTLVKTDFSNIVAAVNEKDGKIVFVVTNTDSAKKTYDFNTENFATLTGNIEVYETTKTRDCELKGVYEKANGIEVAPYSVTTVVMNAEVGEKSIKLAEKNNTKTAFSGDVLEFEVTDEKGNEIVVESVPQKVVCKEAGIIRIEAEYDGYKAKKEVSVVGDMSRVRIIGSGSERALRVSGGDVVIADRTNDASQIWVLEKNGDYYAFKNEKTGKYLSTERFLTTSVLNDNALWTIEKDKGLLRIINKATGDSVDVYNHATENGSQVGVYKDYYATANQLFYLEIATPESEVEQEYFVGEIAVSGTPFGTKPWDGDENVTFDKAWDGDKETFFHADRDADRTGFTAVDLGQEHLPFNKIEICSRPGFEYRGWGATISGCDEKDGEYKIIHTFTEEDYIRGEFASVNLDEYVNYRYIKYETPQGGYTNVGEIRLIYAPKTPEVKIENGKLVFTGAKKFLVSFYDGDVLKKTEVKKGGFIELSESDFDVRIHALGKENVILGTFFVKKY